MAGILDAVTVDLGSTPTYARREATWVPSADCPGDGTLIVRLWKGKRAGSRCESATYSVQADGPRGWLVLNETDPDSEVYRVDLDPRAKRPCTCPAATAGLGCRHADALRALAADGAL